MKLDKEKLWTQIQASDPQPIQPAEAEAVYRMLMSDSMIRVMRVAFQEAATSTNVLLGADLLDTREIGKCIKIQGKALGMVRMLEGMMDLVNDVLGDEDNAG